MGLSSDQLAAFAEVIRKGSFSAAASSLFITQSALSQRVLNLEKELGTTLLIRDASGLRMTPAGEEVLRYSKMKEELEREVLARLGCAKADGKGRMRIAGFSSVMRSVVLPVLDELLDDAAEIELECFSRELRELPQMLRSGEADMIVTVSKSRTNDWVSHLLGYEENVLVERKSGAKFPDVYLDHDIEDETTFAFLKQNRLEKNIRRTFLDDVYSIIDGVKLGWGKAVVPKHLIQEDPSIKVLKGHKPLRVPVFLQYFEQPYYSSLHQKTVGCLCQKAGKRLGP